MVLKAAEVLRSNSAALFAVGLSMARQGSSHAAAPVGESDAAMACVLILTKILVLPSLCLTCYTLLSHGCGTARLSTAIAAFIYGTFPTAPSVCVFASKYNISTQVHRWAPPCRQIEKAAPPNMLNAHA